MSTTISNNGLPPQLSPATGNPASSGAAASAGSTAETGSRSAAGSTAAPTTVRGTDQVKLTDSARALQAAGRVDDSAAIDSKRVDQIRAAIANGSYQINPGQIADRMVSMDNQLGGTGKA